MTSSVKSTPGYRGRFAPSPTGPLHFGSLAAAVGSFLQARSQGGEWFVRIEDLDPPREMAGAADHILRTLEGFGLCWDGPVVYQSRRAERYAEYLSLLQERGVLYPCGCSRRDIAAGSEIGVYPGTCRNGLAPGKTPRSLRVRVAPETVGFHDRLQGRVTQDLVREVGDFVVRRADGLTSYQLAVVVDDAEAGVTEVVRGSDLLDSTPRQIFLQRLLGLEPVGYIHLPVAMNELGQKLSKQSRAPAVDSDRPVPVLWQVLAFLGQDPPASLAAGTVAEFWEWAIGYWRVEKVPPAQRKPADHLNRDMPT